MGEKFQLIFDFFWCFIVM
ncbi:hypothetical protein D4764_11G0010610 [Takifugu flavidus]|uniref:Uncharacterized protein n=1 Tax=Takifugu flavidus TaxID=433684 RepID=A0A5C6PL08_9TELE|nr:hypothetical protein D4764_11G0010610 [Takifugu flavidus]